MIITLNRPKLELLYLVNFSDKYPTEEKHDIKITGNNVSIGVPPFLGD